MCEQDLQFLERDELHRLSETINAMANSSGGVITLEGGRKIHVDPLEWYDRPQTLNGRVWRRIEGQNVASSLWAKSVMARDAQTLSADDFPVSADTPLNAESLEAFRHIVLGRHEEYRCFARDEFLRRTGIFSGKHLTSAGALMFGETVNVRAVLKHGKTHAEIEALNIWDAYTNILPRITLKLSAKCTESVRDAFAGALLHADYTLDTHITAEILSSPPRIVINYPGLIRPNVRNHRLARIFALAGFHAPIHTHAVQDMLNFRAITTIFLEGLTSIVL